MEGIGTTFLIELATFLTIYLTNKNFIKYCGKILNKRNRLVINIFPILTTFITIILIKKIYISIIYIQLFFIYLVLFKIAFENSIGLIFNVVIYRMFNFILSRDIAVGLISLLLGRSIYEISNSYELYIVSFSLGGILMHILFYYFNRVYDVNLIKKLLINTKGEKVSSIIIVVLSLTLLNSNYTYYYRDLGYVLYPTYIILIDRVCLYIYFYFLLNMKIKSLKWRDKEFNYKANLLKINYNKTSDERLKEYSKLLKIYNHDFKNVLLSIKDFLDVGNLEAVKELIYSLDDRAKKEIIISSSFSNNDLLNALFSRLYDICEENNIKCEFNCYIPKELNIDEIDLINIFNNLSNNAFEACIKQDSVEKKYIIFKSYVERNYLIIYQSNSFNGEIKFKNGTLITSKRNKNNHGIGVESIKYIVDRADGSTFINVNNENNEFKFLIKLPLVNGDT